MAPYRNMPPLLCSKTHHCHLKLQKQQREQNIHTVTIMAPDNEFNNLKSCDMHKPPAVEKRTGPGLVCLPQAGIIGVILRFAVLHAAKVYNNGFAVVCSIIRW